MILNNLNNPLNNNQSLRIGKVSLIKIYANKRHLNYHKKQLIVPIFDPNSKSFRRKSYENPKQHLQRPVEFKINPIPVLNENDLKATNLGEYINQISESTQVS